MKKVLTVLAAVIVIAVAVSFYRGWLTLSRPSSDPGSNKMNVNLESDPDKVKEDVQKVKDKSRALTGNLTDGAKDSGEAANDSGTATGE